MRERLREGHKMFIWDEEYGTAYEAVRATLLQRLRRSPLAPGVHSARSAAS